MMLASSQVSVLSEMGIPVWQLRQTGVAPAEVVDHDLEIDTDTTDILSRVNASTWLFCHDAAESQQIQRLLQSICLALEVDQGFCLLSASELKAIASETLTGSEKRLVLFGESIVKQVFGLVSTIESLRYEPQQALQSQLTTFVSSSLQSLLDQPENKKQVWQDIRQMKLLNG